MACVIGPKLLTTPVLLSGALRGRFAFRPPLRALPLGERVYRLSYTVCTFIYIFYLQGATEKLTYLKGQ